VWVLQGPRGRRHDPQGDHAASALTAQEKTEGRALFCCANATSDITIECREVHGAGDIPIKKIPAAWHDGAPGRRRDRRRLQLPATERMQFLAGQYVEFLLRDGKRRSYSIATPPHEEARSNCISAICPAARSPTTCLAPRKACRP
jgi:CDP-4-dehydro-6-deoxyglucose reductase